LTENILAKPDSATVSISKADIAKIKGRSKNQPPLATVITAVLLVFFFAIIFFVLPERLPRWMLYLLATVNATLLVLLPIFASKEFGKGRTRKEVPLLGKFDVGTLGGAALGLITVGWWFSPLAPIGVGIPSADEIAEGLSTEITLATLTMPDLVLAVIEPPIPPEPLAAEAARIPYEAGAHARLIKAIAERRYAEASLLVDRAAAEGADEQKLHLARGQIEVYSGNYSAAPPHFAAAVAMQEDAVSLGQLTVAQALAGDMQAAYASATRLLDGARSGSIPGENAQGVALNIKAAVALVSGRFDEAISLTEGSQSAWEMAEDSAHKATSRNNQAVVYAMLPKKFAGAATQFDAALALWGKLYGHGSAHAQMCRHNLAVLAMASGDFTTADKQFSQSREAIRQAFGDRSPAYGVACVPAARLFTWVGRFSTADGLLEAAQKTVGRSPVLEVAVDAARGSLMVGQGQYADAAGALAKSRTNGKALLVPQHPFFADINIRWANVNVLRERGGDTIEVCREAIRSLDDHMVRNHPLTARAFNVMGQEQSRRDQKADAKQSFEKARTVTAANRTETGESMEAGIALRGLARLHSKRSWRDAIYELRAAIKVEVDAFGRWLAGSDEVDSVDTPRTADYWFDQAVFYTAYGDRGEQQLAGTLFNQVIALRQRLLSPTHPELAATYSAYAKWLTKQDRKAEAEQMEQRAEEIRKAHAEIGGD
jgi:tetratricopeptide (TPR) repeat protein